MRSALEPLIYSKAIDHKRDVKRGKINHDPIIDELLAAYRSRIKQTNTHS